MKGVPGVVVNSVVSNDVSAQLQSASAPNPANSNKEFICTIMILFPCKLQLT